MQLPINISTTEFDNVYRLQPEKWSEAIREVCVEHGIAFERFKTFGKDGSNLLGSVQDRYIIKIFPLFHRHQWESERRVLRHLWKNDLKIPIPEFFAEGERADGWTYLILSKIPGQTLEQAWPSFNQTEKTLFLHEIGRMMSLVHSLPVGDLHDLEPEWNSFIQKQISGCYERQKRLGAPAWLLSGLNEYLEKNHAYLPKGESVILTGEYTPFNLMVDGEPGKWKMSGMIDFGDAMIGCRDYDLDGPLLFLCEGNKQLVDALLTGYGYPKTELSVFRKRMMLITLLHRYSNLNSQICIPGWQTRVSSIEELEALIIP